jgi:hypothetical protein
MGIILSGYHDRRQWSKNLSKLKKFWSSTNEKYHQESIK